LYSSTNFIRDIKLKEYEIYGARRNYGEVRNMNTILSGISEIKRTLERCKHERKDNVREIRSKIVDKDFLIIFQHPVVFKYSLHSIITAIVPDDGPMWPKHVVLV
jgi:hypothetical protein